jgi:dihydroxyacetone kinase-like protein
MDANFIIKCIDEVNHTIIINEKEIESLDRAIGDGDHFINLKRGSIAIQSMKDELLTLNNSQIFQKIGMKILSTVGGASGPLFATFFLEISKTLKDNDNESHNFYEGFSQAVSAIKHRGKSDIGQKNYVGRSYSCS